jgi:hypothetical protein
MNIGDLTKTIVAAANNELKNKIISIATQAYQGQPQQQQLVQLITGFIDQAIQQIGAGAGMITVPVSGGAVGAPSVPGFALGGAPATLGGFAPQAQMQAAPVASGKMPANTVVSLRECGPVVRISSQQYPQAPPPGAKCGVEFKQKDANNGNPIFCAKDAAVVNTNTSTWCCKTHSSRKTVDLGGKGGKKSGPTSGSAGVQPGAHLRGIMNPAGIPGVFNTAPQAQTGLAAIMGQNPFQGANPFGGGLMQPPVASNPLQGAALMNSVPSAASAIPSQQPPPFNPINFGGMMGTPAPNAVAIGAPFNPMNTKVTVEEDDDESGEDSGEDSDEQGGTPMPAASDLAAALAAGGMGGLLPQSAPIPAGNPGLLAALQGQQPAGGLLPTNFAPPAATPSAVPAPSINNFLAQALTQQQQTTPAPTVPAPITAESALAAAMAAQQNK